MGFDLKEGLIFSKDFKVFTTILKMVNRKIKNSSQRKI